MNSLTRTACVAAVAAVCSTIAQAQTPFRTSWGDPDLEGTWNNATQTLLERPAALGDKLFWTEAEAAAIDKNGVQEVLKRFAGGIALSGELNASWMEPSQVVRSRRTSLIVDPPDGKIPYTPEGRKRWDATPRLGMPMKADSPEERNLAERCLGADDIMLPNPFYNNNHQIVQTQGYVVISSEMMHEVRIVPVDGRPHLNKAITRWVGDSRGWWEGQTLVVETMNFNEKRRFQGATSTLKTVERFTRVDASMLDYQLTVSDPATFTRPWTIVNTLRPAPGLIYEVACHEGNYGLAGILRGARADDTRR